MQPHPLPTVPKKLQEMLADHPELIERLQGVLNRSAERSRRIPLDPFEDAVSIIEGCLEKFNAEAREAVRLAEASGDQSLLATAKSKELLLSSARQKRHWIADDALLAYFGSDFR